MNNTKQEDEQEGNEMEREMLKEEQNG